jgi:hypothetical protein
MSAWKAQIRSMYAYSDICLLISSDINSINYNETSFSIFPVPVCALTASGVPGGTFVFYESF